MKKILKRIVFCLCVTVVSLTVFLCRDHSALSSHLIRMHVVANSDSDTDQQIKLQVRDAVLNSIQEDLKSFRDKDAALEYLKQSLPKIRNIANAVLAMNGSGDTATASVCAEPFSVRHYDIFSLPSGVYDTLRIVIGEGSGKNWWCVTFPSLCMQATSDGFIEEAAAVGLSEDLTSTLRQPSRYKIRFFLLDCFGKLENRLFETSVS